MSVCKVNNWIINRREKIVPKRRFKLVFSLQSWKLNVQKIKIRDKKCKRNYNLLNWLDVRINVCFSLANDFVWLRPNSTHEQSQREGHYTLHWFLSVSCQLPYISITYTPACAHTYTAKHPLAHLPTHSKLTNSGIPIANCNFEFQHIYSWKSSKTFYTCFVCTFSLFSI